MIDGRLANCQRARRNLPGFMFLSRRFQTFEEGTCDMRKVLNFKRLFTLLLLAMLPLLASAPAFADKGDKPFGGKPNRGGGGGGNSRPGAPSRPSAPAENVDRRQPNISHSPSLSRPQVSRPSLPTAKKPSVSMPQITRPTIPAKTNRPEPSRPNVGLPQVIRPAIDRPSIPGGNKPVTRPGFGPGNIAIERPDTRPRPNLPTPTRPERPTVKLPPTSGGSLPGVSTPTIVLKPGQGERPDRERPGSGRPNIDRPSVDRPPVRPGETGPGDVRPGIVSPERPPVVRPGTDRPSTRPEKPGNVGDFIDLPDRLRPTPGFTRPDRPTKPGEARPFPVPQIIDDPKGPRPGTGDGRPGDGRPGDGRPETRPVIRPDRPNITIHDRPANWENRPSWAVARPGDLRPVNDRWQTAIGRPPRYPSRPWDQRPWQPWASDVHRHVHNHNHYYHNCFGSTWWNRYPTASYSWWHYRYGNYRPSYWWGVPRWNVLASFVVGTSWASQPTYVDYGNTVIYTGDTVVVNGSQVATADEFALSAAQLAAVAPPQSEAEADAAEWMPLGTFALSTDKSDTEPTKVIQLAISKDGIISGTYFNSATDAAMAIQGSVDKETQRVAFQFVEKPEIIMETGLYNLTQEDAPLIVHFSPTEREEYLLIRLKADPAEIDTPAALP